MSPPSLILSSFKRYPINIKAIAPPKFKKNVDIYFDDLKVKGILRIDSEIEIDYYNHGGILNYVLNKMI